MTHPTCTRTDTHPPHAELCQGVTCVCFGVPAVTVVNTYAVPVCHLHEEVSEL